jgi:hypothetical protein
MNREAGKGSSPRPFGVSRNEFDNNWNRTFGKSKPKTVKLVNPLNQEEWLCENYHASEFIDGVEYVRVHKFDNARSFLMRKDALKKI